MTKDTDNDLVGDNFGDAISPNDTEVRTASNQFESMRELAQSALDWVATHCQSSRMIASNGDEIIVTKPEEPKGLSPLDGPIPPYGFRFGGQTIDVPPIPWRLLSFMWRKESESIDSVECNVWGHDQDVGASALKSAIHALNNCLQQVGFPKYLARKNGHLCWR